MRRLTRQHSRPSTVEFSQQKPTKLSDINHTAAATYAFSQIELNPMEHWSFANIMQFFFCGDRLIAALALTRVKNLAWLPDTVLRTLQHIRQIYKYCTIMMKKF